MNILTFQIKSEEQRKKNLNTNENGSITDVV